LWIRHSKFGLSCLLAQPCATGCLHNPALHLAQSPDRVLQLDDRRASSELHDASAQSAETIDSCTQTQIVANRLTFASDFNLEMPGFHIDFGNHRCSLAFRDCGATIELDRQRQE